jgi:uncharacterized protein (DUF4415 family)
MGGHLSISDRRTGLTFEYRVYTLRLCSLPGNERKRRVNIKAHGLDFQDTPRVFEGSAGPREMKKRSSSKSSKTDWKRIRTMKDKDISISAEHPEADVRHIVRGIVRRGLQPVPPKASIALRLDADVLEWFKAQGPGYQTRINAVLRAFRDASL